MGRVLLVSYMFPPMGGVGVQRVAKFAKYLPRAGWDVSVLTVEDPPTATVDASMLADIPDSVRIHRAWSLEPTRAIQALKRLRGGSDAPDDSAAASKNRAGVSGASPGLIRFVQAFFVPDEKRLWRGRARREGLRALREDGCTAVVSSGPPFTSHIIGRDIARAAGVPLVADFRDPWVGNSFFRPPTQIHSALHARWERRVVEAAARVVVVSEPMAADLRSRYPEIDASRFVVIPNGFDVDDLPARAAAPIPPLVIAYAGAFQGAIQPDVFFRGIRHAIDRGLFSAGDVRFDFVGPAPEAVAEAARREGMSESVSAAGPLGHREALESVAGAHAFLLVLGAGAQYAPVVTGKLPEYLGMRKPILALVPEGAARDIVTRAGAGVVVDPQDAGGVAEALGDWVARVASGGVLPEPDPSVVAEFDRAAQAATLARLLGDVVAEARA